MLFIIKRQKILTKQIEDIEMSSKRRKREMDDFRWARSCRGDDL